MIVITRERFIAAQEAERYKAQRRSFATADLPDAKVKAIEAARMDARHDRLNALLDSE